MFLNFSFSGFVIFNKTKNLWSLFLLTHTHSHFHTHFATRWFLISFFFPSRSGLASVWSVKWLVGLVDVFANLLCWFLCHSGRERWLWWFGCLGMLFLAWRRYTKAWVRVSNHKFNGNSVKVNFKLRHEEIFLIFQHLMFFLSFQGSRRNSKNWIIKHTITTHNQALHVSFHGFACLYSFGFPSSPR